MAKIAGTTLLDTIVPQSTTSTYATHDSIYGKGGWREVNSWDELALIPRGRMRVGMAVCVGGNLVYTLKSMGDRPEDDDWQPVVGAKGDKGDPGAPGSINNFLILSRSEYNRIEKQLNIIYCVYEDGSEEDADPTIEGSVIELNAEIEQSTIELVGELDDNILIL